MYRWTTINNHPSNTLIRIPGGARIRSMLIFKTLYQYRHDLKI